MVTGSSELSIKRKLPEKQGRLPKKPKTVLEPVVGLEAEGRKTITPAKHGAGKGLMTGSSTTQESHPSFLGKIQICPGEALVHPYIQGL